MILIKGKVYDALKFVAQVVLPACATLYFTLSGLWGLPAADQVVGTIVAIDTFLGVILQLSSTAYNNATIKGGLKVLENGSTSTISLEFDGDPGEDLEGKKRAIFDVEHKKKSRSAPEE